MGTHLVFPEQRPLPDDLSSRLEFDALSVLPARYRDETFDISVIIPVYNVAPYVEQCLHSVFNQIGVRVQVIIINDGSTDGSLEIVIDYVRQRRPDNCIVVDADNKGPSVSRNIGQRLAVGEFIAYLDSDDFVPSQAYGTLVGFAQLHDLDLVLFRGLVFDHVQLRCEPFYDSWAWEKIMQGRETLVTTSLRTPDLLLLEPSVALRIVRRSFAFFMDLRFPEGLFYEDLPVHVKGLITARSVGLVNECFYYYRVNRPGKRTSDRSRRRFDVLSIIDNTLGIIKPTLLSPEQGAALLFGLLRITWWCGENTLPSDRRDFYKQAIVRFRAMPRGWVKQFKATFKDQPAMRRRLGAFRRGDADVLAAESLGMRRRRSFPSLLLQQMRRRSIFAKGGSKKTRRYKPSRPSQVFRAPAESISPDFPRLSPFLFPAPPTTDGRAAVALFSDGCATRRNTNYTLGWRLAPKPLDEILREDLSWIETRFFGHQLIEPLAGSILLDIGARSGVFSLHLAAMNPMCQVLAVESDPERHQILVETIRRSSFPNIIVLCSVEEALATVEGKGGHLPFLKIDASHFNYCMIREIVTRFKVGHLCGQFDELEAKPIDVYRLSCQHSRTFCWYNLTEHQRISGYGTSDIEVSIVVPAYKVAEYVPECLDSLVRQTIFRKEIIVVDDGSPDESGKIADEWAEKHAEVRVIHKENGGCASARSAGLAAACGRYVGFIDSDDWVDEGMFEALFTAAALNNADVSQCGFRTTYEGDGTVEIVHECLPCEGGKRGLGVVADVKDMIVLAPAIWRCLYRTDFLRSNKIDFAHDIKRHDDLPFRVEVFMHNPRAVVIPEVYYNYRLNRAGQDVDVADERLFVHFQIFEYLRSKFRDIDRAELERQLKRVQIASHFWALGKLEPQLKRRYWLAAARDIFNTGMLVSRFDILRLSRGMPLARQLALTAAMLVASLQPRRGP